MIQQGEVYPNEIRPGDVIGVRIAMDVCTGRITAQDGPARVRILRIARNPSGQIIVLDSNQQVYALSGYTYELYERGEDDDDGGGDWPEIGPGPEGPPGRRLAPPVPAMKALPPPRIQVPCRPARHHHIIKAHHDVTGKGGSGVQGFVDEHGVFYRRQAAASHVLACGQEIVVREDKPELRIGHRLYSEDLW